MNDITAPDDIGAANREFFAKQAELGAWVKHSEQLDKALGNYYQSLTSLTSIIREQRPAQRATFRGSDLPFCGKKFLLDNLRPEPRYEDVRYMSEFYTRNGDVFHENLQKWLGACGLMYGKWKCKKCGKRYPDTDEPTAGVQGPVSCCQAFAEYVEFAVDDGMGFKGHMDGVIFINGKYMCIELKQMGSHILNRRLNQGPDEHHYKQIQIYRSVFPKWVGIPEERFHPFVLLWYFDRGDAKVNKRWVIPANNNVYLEETSEYETTQRLMTAKQYSRIKCRCKTATDNIWCPYNERICFNQNTDERDRILASIMGNKGPINV